MKYMMAKVLTGESGFCLRLHAYAQEKKSYPRRTGRFMRRHVLWNRRWKCLGFLVFLSGTTEFAIMTGTVTM